MFTKKHQLIFALVLFYSLQGIQKAQTLINVSNGLILKNSLVEMKFEPMGMGLSEMKDLKTGYNHIRTVKGKHLLWEVTFGKGIQRESITNNYKPCSFASITELKDNTQHVVLEWNNMRWWEEDSVVSVKVTIDLPAGSGIAMWRISVRNNSDYWGLWSVGFPKINGFPQSGAYDVARPAFACGGLLLKNWKGRIDSRYPSGDFPMQFMSFNHSTNAVYFASIDPDARAKDFTADARKDEMAMVHYPENMGIAGSDYPDYYPVEFGIYQGGWLEAAQIYRSWALKQKWAEAGPISKRKDIPSNLKNLGIWIQDEWVWDNAMGNANEMNAPLLNARKILGVPMGIHWYDWHHMTFDNLYPYFLPPKPGFRERVKELTDSSFIVMPYINGSSADMNIPNWSEFAPHAIQDEAGGFRMQFYRDGAGRLLSMCPTQEFWREKISSLVDSLLDNYGCNGVYIDQISAYKAELCFNKEHGHPIGGGRYWADGYRELLSKVDKIAHRKGQNKIISSEGADEIFFDRLNANLMWAGPSDREIPLMYVVYSGYTIFFGSLCDYKKSDNLFCFAQGRAFLEGRQNGWMDLGLFKPKYKGKITFLRKCGKYHEAAKKFLTYGRLLSPLYPVNKIPVFKSKSFGCWSDKHEGSVPAAEAMLWESEDGHLGIFIANYINRQVPFKIYINPKDYGLNFKRYKLSEIKPEGNTPLGEESYAIKLNELLDGQSLRIIEIEPASY